MTRSRQRKLRRCETTGTGRILMRATPLATAMLACMPAAHAQVRGEGEGLEEVIVTATKRVESLQDVPLSIQAIGNAKLEELHVESFEDYAKFLPSVTYQTFGPGLAKIYMRGISTGGTPNHSGPLPSVGVYLAEQPIPTITRPLHTPLYHIQPLKPLPTPPSPPSHPH